MKVIKYSAILFLSLSLVACGMNSKESISEEKATSIAIKDAGFNENDVNIAKVGLDRDDYEYEVKFTTGDAEYNYTIDSISGEILDKEKEILPAKAPEAENIEDEYLQKALTHFSFTKEEVMGIKVEKDLDDGREMYDVSFYKDNTQYSCEFDATTKQLLKSETDLD